MLSIEQDETVFAAALRVAERRAGEGAHVREVVAAAMAVVAAAKASQTALEAEDE